MMREYDEMESTEKKQPRQRALFEALDLIESFVVLQNDDIAKQLQKQTAQFNELLTLPPRKE